MWARLHELTPPATPPVSLAEAKNYLRVTHADEDAEITRMIDAARRMIDGPDGAGVAMVSQQWRATLDRFPARIDVPLWPVISIDSVSWLGDDGLWSDLDATDYRVIRLGRKTALEPAFGGAWPQPRLCSASVRVDFTAGFASVPQDLQTVVLMLTAHFYKLREPVVVGAVTSEPPLGVNDILSRYRAGYVG